MSQEEMKEAVEHSVNNMRGLPPLHVTAANGNFRECNYGNLCMNCTIIIRDVLELDRGEM